MTQKDLYTRMPIFFINITRRLSLPCSFVLCSFFYWKPVVLLLLLTSFAWEHGYFNFIFIFHSALDRNTHSNITLTNIMKIRVLRKFTGKHPWWSYSKIWSPHRCFTVRSLKIFTQHFYRSQVNSCFQSYL